MGQLQFCETRMWSEQALSIKWNQFSDNIKESYKTLRQENNFSDVTLACEDGQQIEAHKIVLTSSSSVLEEILKSFRQPHPLIYLRGVKVQTLTNLVDFIYHGQVDLLEENLEAFLTLAQEMKLKGIENDGKSATTESLTTATPSPPQGPTNKRKRAKQEKVVPAEVLDMEQTEYHDESTDSTKEFDNQTFREKTEEHGELSGITTIEEMDEKIQTVMSRVDGLWTCNICGKANRNRVNITTHIEGRHTEGVPVACTQCNQVFRNRDALRQHIGRKKCLAAGFDVKQE